MKYLFFFLVLVSMTSTTAQNLIAEYNFNGFAHDESGNGYDGTLYGGAYIANYPWPGVLFVGETDSDYMSIPAEVFNGLNDFTILLKARLTSLHAGSAESSNTYFSASDSYCIHCFGLSFNAYTDNWQVAVNGTLYSIPSNWGGEDKVFLRRENGLISLYLEGDLKGTIYDNSTLEIASISIGQKENCLGGCFKANQSLNGGINSLKVWDGALPLKVALSESEMEFVFVYPNPISSSTTIQFTLNESSPVSIRLFSVDGKEVMTIAEGNFSEGKHEIILNGEALVRGMYFLSVKTATAFTSKIVVE